MKLLIATRNRDKLREMRELLGGLEVEVVTLEEFPSVPEVEETGSTLEENAGMKASTAARTAGLHAVADDSGLFVPALDGRPGVRSARYAGPEATDEDLCRKLLREMRDVPERRREAAFRCCVVMSDPGGQMVLTATGAVEGRITEEMRGDGGFGYDPVFYHPDSAATFAALSPRRKNAVSHRGKALRRFREEFVEFLERPED